MRRPSAKEIAEALPAGPVATSQSTSKCLHRTRLENPDLLVVAVGKYWLHFTAVCLAIGGPATWVAWQIGHKSVWGSGLTAAVGGFAAFAAATGLFGYVTFSMLATRLTFDRAAGTLAWRRSLADRISRGITSGPGGSSGGAPLKLADIVAIELCVGKRVSAPSGGGWQAYQLNLVLVGQPLRRENVFNCGGLPVLRGVAEQVAQFLGVDVIDRTA